MKINDRSIRWSLLLALTGVVLTLVGCSGPNTRVWPDAPGWSRGLLLGQTGAGDPVEIALDDDGQPYYLLTPQDESGATLRLVSLTEDGDVSLDRTYDVELSRPDQPAVIFDGDVLRLFWISDRSLFTMSVDHPSGEPLGEPQLVSPDDRSVDSYALVSDANGDVRLWYAGPTRDPGLYALDWETGDSHPVDPDGVRPQLAFDNRGQLHALWAQLPVGYEAKSFHYARYPQGSFAPGRATLVQSFSVGPSTLIEGPAMGVAGDRVHVFWAKIIRTGMQAGSAEARHLTFTSAENALDQSASQLFVPARHNLPYEPASDATWKAGERTVLPAEGIPRTGFIVDIHPIAMSATDTTVAAVTSRIDYLRRKNRRQIGLLFFSGQEPTAYQLVSFTSGESTTPAIRSDSQGYLFLTWQERTGLPGFGVYTATTRPEMVTSLNQFTREDYGRVFAEALFGMLTGAILAPLAAAIWALLPLLILLIATPVRKESAPLSHWATLLSLTLALAAFWAAKQATFPQMMTYVPFSAWVPRIPQAVGEFLQVLVPIAIGVIAVGTAWYLTYRRERNSVIYFLLAYAAVDSALSGAVYGVLVYGAV